MIDKKEKWKELRTLRGRPVVFNEETHVYKWGKKRLVSANQLLDTLFEPFDKRAVARKLSKFPHNKKNKRGVRYWLAQWKEKAELGTLIHKQIDGLARTTRVNDEEFIMEYEIIHPQAKVVVNYLLEANKEWLYSYKYYVHSEKFVVAPDYGICGTVDHVVKNHDDYSIIITDWKTCKEITDNNYDDKMGVHKLTRHLKDTKLNRYKLQLMLYAFLLIDGDKDFSHGGDVKKLKEKISLRIGHVSNKKLELIPVEYDHEMVKEILEDYRISSGWVPYTHNDNSGF
jgi:hypothetical protein